MEPTSGFPRRSTITSAIADKSLEFFNALFDRIVEEFEPRNVDARGISQLVWAFSTAAYPRPDLYRSLLTVLPPRLHELNTQNLSMVAWAYGNAEYYDADLFESVARETDRRLHSFNELQIATTIWGLGKFRPAPPPGVVSSLGSIASMLCEEDRRSELTAPPLHRWSAGHLAMSLYLSLIHI